MKMAKKVTLDDVARETGLSKYAVSRAISGKPGVSSATRERVLQMCEKLGYTRTPSTAALKYIVLFAPKSQMDTAAFWMRVIQGVETAATQKGFTLSLKTVEETTDEAEVQALLQNAAGAIFISHKTCDLIQQAEGHCPTLLLTYPPVPLIQTDCLNISDSEAMEALCDYMISWGHRRIAYYGPTKRIFGMELIQGISRSMGKAGLAPAEIWSDTETPDSYQNTVAMLTERKKQDNFPTAILCASDQLAQSVIYALGLLSISVPQEVSVTSFNSDTGLSTVIPVTSMGFDKFRYGVEAFNILYQRILNPELPFRRIRYIQQFVRGSTAGELYRK